MARRGLVEPRKGFGLPFLYWVVEDVEEPVDPAIRTTQLPPSIVECGLLIGT